MSSSRPTPGQLLRTDTDRLVQEIRRHLDGAAREEARERLLKALGRKREVAVLLETNPEATPARDAAQSGRCGRSPRTST